MKFESKYGIGDEVWIMYENKLLRTSILSITIICPSIHNAYFIQYSLSEGGSHWEQQVFETKDELLESLTQKV